MCIGSLITVMQGQDDIGNNRENHPRSAYNPNTFRPMQRPVLGFVYASDAGELRAIFGIPGASIFSDALELPLGITNVHFSPGQRYAIVERGDEAPLGIIDFAELTQGLLVNIPGAISKPDIVSFNPSGSAVAVYSSSEGRLQVIGGLPEAPRLIREMTRGDLPDEVRLLALADDGIALLEGSNRGLIYLLANDGSVRFLHEAGDLAAMVFSLGSHDVLIFDRIEGSASLLKNVLTAPLSILLINGLITLDGDIDLWIDSNKAIITSANTMEVWQIDRKSMQVKNLQLPARPGTLQLLRAAGKFLFSYLSGEPAWILDASAGMPSLYSVPAPVLSSKERGRAEHRTRMPRPIVRRSSK